MNAIDFTPLYRSTVGFDRLANLLDSTLQQNHSNGYPPYNIEATEENHYSITIAVAGFTESELDIYRLNAGYLPFVEKKNPLTSKIETSCIRALQQEHSNASLNSQTM